MRTPAGFSMGSAPISRETFFRLIPVFLLRVFGGPSLETRFVHNQWSLFRERYVDNLWFSLGSFPTLSLFASEGEE